MLALKIKARKYNPPIKRTPFSHLAFVQLLALFFRVLLLCKVVLLNKCSKIIGSCFLSGIVVLGRRLSATSLYCSLKNITQHFHSLPFFKTQTWNGGMDKCNNGINVKTFLENIQRHKKIKEH